MYCLDWLISFVKHVPSLGIYIQPQTAPYKRSRTDEEWIHHQIHRLPFVWLMTAVATPHSLHLMFHHDCEPFTVTFTKKVLHLPYKSRVER